MPDRRIALLLIFVSSLSCGAEHAPWSKESRSCLEKAGAVDPAMLECISDEYERQDKRLNTAYRKLMNTLTGERKKQLLEAQRLWGKYTEANCAFYYPPNAGSLDRIMAAECQVNARIERAAELERMANF